MQERWILGFGYSNYEKFTAFADLGYKNLFGMNKQASLKIGYNSLESCMPLIILIPGFFDRDPAIERDSFPYTKEERISTPT